MIPYGGGSADFAMYNGRIVPGQAYTVWYEKSGGSQVIGLEDAAGVPVLDDIVSADSRGMLEFFAPEDAFPVWVEAVGDDTGTRVRLDPANLSATVADTVATVDSFSAQLVGLGSDIIALEAVDDGHDTAITTIQSDIEDMQDDIDALSSSLTPSTTGYNVRDYGATGDGTTDDSAAINDCIAAAQANGVGLVIVPPGTYALSASPIKVLTSSLELRLAKGAEIKRTNSSLHTMLQNWDVTPGYTNYSGPGNIQVRGGTWNANGNTLASYVTAMIFTHAENITVENATVRDVRDLHAVDFNSCSKAIARDCIFEGFTAGLGDAYWANAAVNISIDTASPASSNDVLVSGNIVRTYGALDSFGRLAATNSVVNNVPQWNIRCVNNTAYHTGEFVFFFQNCANLTIANNQMFACNGGVSVTLPATDSLSASLTNAIHNTNISNNQMYYGGISYSPITVRSNHIEVISSGATAQALRNVNISNNALWDIDNTVAAIKVWNVQTTSITGNKIYSTPSSCRGIDVEDGNYVVIAHNALRDVGQGGANASIYIRDTSSRCVLSNNTIVQSAFIWLASTGCVFSGNMHTNSSGVSSGGAALHITGARCNVTGNLIDQGAGAAVRGIENGNGASTSISVNNIGNWGTVDGATGPVHNTGTGTNTQTGNVKY